VDPGHANAVNATDPADPDGLRVMQFPKKMLDSIAGITQRQKNRKALVDYHMLADPTYEEDQAKQKTESDFCIATRAIEAVTTKTPKENELLLALRTRADNFRRGGGGEGGADKERPWDRRGVE
jgi:hypothetical protein